MYVCMILYEYFIDIIVIKVICRDINFIVVSVVICYRLNMFVFVVIYIDSGIVCVNNFFYI